MALSGPRGSELGTLLEEVGQGHLLAQSSHLRLPRQYENAYPTKGGGGGAEQPLQGNSLEASHEDDTCSLWLAH